MSLAYSRPMGRSGLLALVIAVGMVASAFAASAPYAASNAARSGSTVSDVTVSIAPTLSKGPISPPRLPHFGSGAPTQLGQVIDPNAGYSAEPAPMGITDFGVTAADTAYTYGTTEFKGTLDWKSIHITGGSGNAFTLQMNLVLRFTDGGTTYAYWIQDVAEPTDDGSSDLTMAFLNNIWNFSGSFAMNSESVTGNGTIYADGSDNYYEYGPASGLPGASSEIKAPGSFSLICRSYLSSTGVPEVAFEYYDGASSLPVTYDNVLFPFARSVSQDNGFTVDGTQYTPGGSPLAYDAELDLGGPGGGSSVTMADPSDMHMTLEHWNGDNWQSTSGAWNFGTDTAESISSTQSIWTWDADGTLSTSQLNGTTRDATPEIAFSSDQVGNVYVTAPCSVTNGVVKVGAEPWDFNGTWANVTLYPGTYPMWVNDSAGASDALGSVTISAGGNTTESAPSVCSGGSSPTVTTPSPSPPTSVDVGQAVTFTTVASGGSGTGYVYTWGASSSSFGCGLGTGASITCTPTAAGTYNVSVFVTDSASAKSAVVPSASYTVYADPAVTLPTPAPAYGRVGQTVTFSTTVTGGDGTIGSYVWTQSSSLLGCSLASAISITCVPAAGGNYSVSVYVTDSNSEKSNTATSLSFTVIAVSVPTAVPVTAETGTTVTFSTLPSGGTGQYPTFNWSESSATFGCALASKATIKCAPTAAGDDYWVSVWVADSAGEYSAPATSSGYNVTAGPSVTAPVPSVPAAEVGQSFSFSTSASGGSGTGYVYTWDASSGLGCTGTKGATLYCTPAVASVFTVGVSVRDSGDGVSPIENTTYTVLAAPVVQVSAAPSTVTVGSSTNIYVNVTYGDPPILSYSYAGLPGGCSSSNTNVLVCHPSAAGSFTIRVTVEDSDLQNATGSVSITVNAASTSNGGLGLSTLDLLLLIAAVVIVAAIGLGYARRRKQEKDDAPPQWSNAPGAGAPPPWQQPPRGGWPPPPGPGWGGPPPQ